MYYKVLFVLLERLAGGGKKKKLFFFLNHFTELVLSWRHTMNFPCRRSHTLFAFFFFFFFFFFFTVTLGKLSFFFKFFAPYLVITHSPLGAFFLLLSIFSLTNSFFLFCFICLTHLHPRLDALSLMSSS